VRKRWGRLKGQEKRVEAREKTVQKVDEDLKRTLAAYRQRLEMVANMTAEEAKGQLLEHLSDDVRARSAAMIRAERARAKEESEQEAKKIISQAIQRCAVDEAVQVSTSSVSLPNEGIKSRIIGKEGRNVRAFESATGVKVVVDDSPETVLLSSFDPAKREVAAMAMKRLIAAGGFAPGRIEEVVADCKNAMEEDIVKAGKKALAEVGAAEVHPELPRYVGMLKYRASLGQNLLQHCLEVAKLAGTMAAEIGLDVPLARRAGLLHDIGKTLSREMEGSHVELGIELSERFNEHPVVKEVIAEHHEDLDSQSPICFVVKAADTISSIRPGGRREDLEGYARRIMRLEEIAHSFEGVRDVYAINAGREIRVMVNGDHIGDDDSEMLAFDIAERVKNELTFAGQVKVMVVRETRAVRYSGRGHHRRGRGSGGRRSRSSRRNRSTVAQN
jgi:ribonuclease Y